MNRISLFSFLTLLASTTIKTLCYHFLLIESLMLVVGRSKRARYRNVYLDLMIRESVLQMPMFRKSDKWPPPMKTLHSCLIQNVQHSSQVPFDPSPLQIGNKWQQTHKSLYLPYFPLARRQKQWMTNCKRLILISKLKCVPAQLEEHTHSGYMGNNGLNLSSYQLNNIFSIKSRGSTAMKTKACPPKMSP